MAGRLQSEAMQEGGVARAKNGKGPGNNPFGATGTPKCATCRKSKQKCHFPSEDAPCARCLRLDIPCSPKTHATPRPEGRTTNNSNSATDPPTHRRTLAPTGEPRPSQQPPMGHRQPFVVPEPLDPEMIADLWARLARIDPLSIPVNLQNLRLSNISAHFERQGILANPTYNILHTWCETTLFIRDRLRAGGPGPQAPLSQTRRDQLQRQDNLQQRPTPVAATPSAIPSHKVTPAAPSGTVPHLEVGAGSTSTASQGSFRVDSLQPQFSRSGVSSSGGVPREHTFAHSPRHESSVNTPNTLHDDETLHFQRVRSQVAPLEFTLNGRTVSFQGGPFANSGLGDDRPISPDEIDVEDPEDGDAVDQTEEPRVSWMR